MGDWHGPTYSVFRERDAGCCGAVGGTITWDRGSWLNETSPGKQAGECRHQAWVPTSLRTDTGGGFDCSLNVFEPSRVYHSWDICRTLAFRECPLLSSIEYIRAETFVIHWRSENAHYSLAVLLPVRGIAATQTLKRHKIIPQHNEGFSHIQSHTTKELMCKLVNLLSWLNSCLSWKELFL